MKKIFSITETTTDAPNRKKPRIYPIVDQKTLQEYFHYDPETGLFTKIKLSPKTRGYDRLGVKNFKNEEGYNRIHFMRNTYQVHRLAWLYMTGEWPKNVIDHIDGDINNNKWSNLRDVTHVMNCQNRKRSRQNTTGFIGVSKERGSNRYRAAITIGTYDTPEEAHEAYVKAKRILHPGGTL